MLMPIGKMVMVMDWHFIFVVEHEFLVKNFKRKSKCFQQNENVDKLEI